MHAGKPEAPVDGAPCAARRCMADAEPAVGEAVRNHLPVDAQVPAGLGTVMGVPDQSF